MSADSPRPPLEQGDPVFAEVADARRLVSTPEVLFDTKKARRMLAACLAIIDQQQRAVLGFERSIWDGGRMYGQRYGYTVGAIGGALVGLVVGFVVRGLLG